jgi:hypothetical protein
VNGRVGDIRVDKTGEVDMRGERGDERENEGTIDGERRSYWSSNTGYGGFIDIYVMMMVL